MQYLLLSHKKKSGLTHYPKESTLSTRYRCVGLNSERPKDTKDDVKQTQRAASKKFNIVLS